MRDKVVRLTGRVARQGKRTDRFFFVDSTSPSSLHAPMPREFPRILTSSRSSISRSSLIWGSRSSAVVILRPFPSRENILVDAVILRGVRSQRRAGDVFFGGCNGARSLVAGTCRRVRDEMRRKIDCAWDCWRGGDGKQRCVQVLVGDFAPPRQAAGSFPEPWHLHVAQAWGRMSPRWIT